MSLYAKRLEMGWFIWPSASDGAISLTRSHLAGLLDGGQWKRKTALHFSRS
jgi:transposase